MNSTYNFFQISIIFNYEIWRFCAYGKFCKVLNLYTRDDKFILERL